MSGGTDLATAFVGGVPTLPVYAGELQARQLGAAVEAFDEAGRPVVDEVGELVLTQPMPSMPLRLWGDDDRSRLRDSYFSVYPGVWRHGDWIEITSRGTAVIYGRSDSTINRGGCASGRAALPAVASRAGGRRSSSTCRSEDDGWIVSSSSSARAPSSTSRSPPSSGPDRATAHHATSPTRSGAVAAVRRRSPKVVSAREAHPAHRRAASVVSRGAREPRRRSTRSSSSRATAGARRGET
jgi:hypothetical protein